MLQNVTKCYVSKMKNLLPPRLHASAGRLAAVIPLAGLVLAGCGGEDRVDVYPVQGKVLYRGEPAAGAEVVFHAAANAPLSPSIPIPRAVVQSDGTFELASFEPGDGAPAGTYDVTVVWPSAAAADADPESGGGQPDRLGGRYANPDTSGLAATVREEETSLEPFELQ
jgi:hypothetical protein